METLKDRVIEARRAGGMPQAEFARAVGISTAAMSQIETGQTKSLKASTAAAIERATGYNAQWLITGRGPKRVFGGASNREQIAFILQGLQRLPPEHRQLVEDQIRALLTVADTRNTD